MNFSKVVVLSALVGFFIMISMGVLKFIVEPNAIKKEYENCMEFAKKDDYNRWQEIERRIVEQDKLKNKLEADASNRYNIFSDNKQVENIFLSCVEKNKKECARLGNDGRLIPCLSNQVGCVAKVREEVYKDVRESEKTLFDLYEKMDANGEILDKELKECKEQYKLFK